MPSLGKRPWQDSEDSVTPGCGVQSARAEGVEKVIPSRNLHSRGRKAGPLHCPFQGKRPPPARKALVTPHLAVQPLNPHRDKRTLTHSMLGRDGGVGLPIDRVLVPLQGVVDSGSHASRHDIGVRGVRSVVLRGVERRPVVQVVNRGYRPRRVRVSVHGSRHPYSVHPAVMGQLIVLSEPGKGEGSTGGERERGKPRGNRKRSREKRARREVGKE